MRYRLPEGCRALSHAGRQVVVAADGTIELDASAAAELAAHGIAVASDAPAKAISDASAKRPAPR